MIVCSKDKIKLFPLALCIGIFLLLLASCRKNEDTVGSDFIDNLIGFNVGFSDTTSIITYTSQYDSVPTRNLSYYILGDMNDPEFGISKAAIVTQFDLPAQEYHWATTGITIDSIVLQIAYTSSTSSYGNKASNQTIKVYEIDEDLGNTASDFYFSNRGYLYKPTVIGTWNGSFTETALGDSVTLQFNGTSYVLPAHLRIRLDETGFVNKLRDADDGVHFLSTTAFMSYFKGLLISPETTPLNPGTGAVAYMNMNSPVTAVVVYYGGGTQKAEFPISSTATVKGNKYGHIHNVTIPVQPLVGGTNKNTNYLEPLTGLKTRVLIPNILDYVKDKNIAITGAEMIFTVDQTKDTSVYKLPGQIRLVSSDINGYNDFISDFNTIDGVDYYGGNYDGSKGEYRFNIIRHIQNLLKQYKKNNTNVNYGLNLLVAADNPIAANRLILDTSPGKVKLKLSYTVIQ